MPVKLTQISINHKQHADNYKKVRSIERKAKNKKKEIYIIIFGCMTAKLEYLFLGDSGRFLPFFC